MHENAARSVDAVHSRRMRTVACAMHTCAFCDRSAALRQACKGFARGCNASASASWLEKVASHAQHVVHIIETREIPWSELVKQTKALRSQCYHRPGCKCPAIFAFLCHLRLCSLAVNPVRVLHCAWLRDEGSGLAASLPSHNGVHVEHRVCQRASLAQLQLLKCARFVVPWS